jgi:hypothetical protein
MLASSLGDASIIGDAGLNPVLIERVVAVRREDRANAGRACAFPNGVSPSQMQIAIFFESDGTVIVDPYGAGPFFEVPIAGPLPETLNF